MRQGGETVPSRRMLPVIVFLATAIGPVRERSASAGDDVEILGSLRCGSDSVSYYVGEYNGRFSLSQLADFDTSRVPASGPFVLISDADTLVVVPRFGPSHVRIISPTRTIRETILFKLSDEKTRLLEKYAEFGHTLPPDPPTFHYAESADENLARLRRECDLDAIAGEGDETERVLNLLEWAHTVVRHDGNSSNPDPRDALNLIRVCREEDRGVNCRMMATILNEALLAMGFKSRFITCKPYDKEDRDCHVTNLVHLPSLGKWIYLDPTFGAYFQDEDGMLLNHAEIRRWLIEGRLPHLPATMDWNGTPRDPWTYVRYMAKNLFRFSSPAGSAFGYESHVEHPQWVALNPVGYDSSLVGTCDSTGRGRTCYTDCAEYFWDEP